MSNCKEPKNTFGQIYEKENIMLMVLIVFYYPDKLHYNKNYMHFDSVAYLI